MKQNQDGWVKRRSGKGREGMEIRSLIIRRRRGQGEKIGIALGTKWLVEMETRGIERYKYYFSTSLYQTIAVFIEYALLY